jgi:hypothetical protein
MRRLSGMALTAAFLFFPLVPARAGDDAAKAVLEKGIKALGGEEKLAKVDAFSIKTKGTYNFGGNENEMTSDAIVKGLDHIKREFGNDNFHGVMVLAGDKGWRKFGDNEGEIEGDRIANEKRNAYLTVIPITLVPLKGKGFKIETAGEEKVGDKPAAVLKITGPDGKDFTLAFDKESGLPVKLVAKVLNFQGEEITSEWEFSDYKDLAGIKKATKVKVKHNGDTFADTEVTDFKVLDKVEPDTFTEPK